MVVRLVALGLVLTRATAAPLGSLPEETLPLAEDDACADDHLDGEPSCALHALQRRAAGLRTARAAAVATSGYRAANKTVSPGHPVLHLDLFRAMDSEDLAIHELANVDMGSIGGVINYLHTDVVGEHVGDYSGYSKKVRKAGRVNLINSVVHVSTRIRNPDTVIDTVGSVDNFVDFARSALFINGEATGPAYNWNYGDIVGAQRIHDRRYPGGLRYQFSFSGYCPNLKFANKTEGAKAAMATTRRKKRSLEAGPGAQEDSAGRRRRGHGPKKQAIKIECMTYAESGNLPYGEILRGGLCPHGTAPGVLPTGSPGCVYTYEPPKEKDVLNLDEFVGITAEDCGKRKCKDWKDFRAHCTNKRYKVKFNYANRRRHTTMKSKLCVEYDIHKACAKSCSSRACRKVPEHKREIGLPFWRGRCREHANRVRAEKLAAAFRIPGATTAHNMVMSPANETCLVKDPEAMCHPDPQKGGMYCSRAWGGVCQPCYIPHTVMPYEDAARTPMCPWSILTEGTDYASPHMQPNCTSSLPQDLCCLYSSTCNKTLVSDPVPLTEDGFAYVSSKRSTDALSEFLGRVANDTYGANVTDVKALAKFAYWLWDVAPLGIPLKRVVGQLKHFV